ncbi:MAG: GLPGLI family protein [Haliscomenobacter sp.]|nr:GLPGLI family protein [Haliscomenobacter sp.]
MKKPFLSLIFLLCLCHVSAQQYIALYAESPLVGDESNVPPEMRGLAAQMKTYKWLIIKGDSSIYFDTTLDTARTNIVLPYGTYGYYTDKARHETMLVRKSSPTTYLATTYTIQEAKNWAISKESVPYKGLKAYLAEGKVADEQIKVFFAPQIPIPFGPEQYSGLPGLVVRVEKSNKLYELVSFAPYQVKEFNFIHKKDLDLVDNETYKIKADSINQEILRRRNLPPEALKRLNEAREKNKGNH